MHDPISAYGIKAALRHRLRGINLGMFLGLFKYYRQSYMDLLKAAGSKQELGDFYSLFITRIFDRMEIGICLAWARENESKDYVVDLQEHNRKITNEKALVTNLASAIGLPESKIIDLRLLAQFHDIGKVGIPDRILFKPGPLTTEEFNEMKRHCEIGYRIAKSAPDLNHVADWILKHHEWWNGQGYPLGLKGADIPLECRILAIADAYDAMTSQRPYRKAMRDEDALNELKRCAAIQFDPQLVQTFIKVAGKNPGAGINKAR